MKKTPLVFKSRNLTNAKLSSIREMLFNVDWMKMLNGQNSNENYNIYASKIESVMDEISPIKTVRISSRRCYSEPCMSRGLEISNREKMTLYKRTLLIICKHKHKGNIVSYICLPRGRHSEAAHEKRLLCAQKCTRSGWGGVGWGGSCIGG